MTGGDGRGDRGCLGRARTLTEQHSPQCWPDLAQLRTHSARLSGIIRTDNTEKSKFKHFTISS